MSETKKTIADRFGKIGEAVSEGLQAVEDSVIGAHKKAEEAKDHVKASVTSREKDGETPGNGGGGAF